MYLSGGLLVARTVVGRGVARADEAALDADAAALEASGQGPATYGLVAQYAAYQVQQADGSKVARVGNRRTTRPDSFAAMVQDTTADQPILKTGATPAGKPALRFSATATNIQYLETASLADIKGNWTVLSVARSTGATSYGASQNVVAGAGNSDGYPRILQLRYNVDGTNPDSAAATGFTGPNGDEKFFQDDNRDAFSATRWQVLSARRTTTKLECFVGTDSDGDKTEVANASGSTVNTSGRRPLRIGTDDNTASAEPLNGLVAEVLFYNRDLSDSELTQSTNYLKRVYGV